MKAKISQIIEKSQSVSMPSVSLLLELIPRQQVLDILEETQRNEKRRRKLRSEWVIWICIVMAWMPRRSIQSVMSKLWQVSSLMKLNPTAAMASASAISQARYRLGVKPLEQLFKRVCRPMASPETIGAFYEGKRLVGIDGTSEVVADSSENADYFGYAKGKYGQAAYPQLKSVYLCELGTHLIFDATVSAYSRGEHPMACRLLRSVTSEMLILADAGLSSFDIISGCFVKGADVLARAHASRKWTAVKHLADGSFLAWLAPTDKSKDAKAASVLVRIIRYTLDDKNRVQHGQIQELVTTLLDPIQYPACDLIVVYHERWEVEIAIDEMDTHQRIPHRPFRSLKPLGVLQEFYAFLVAYFLIRLIMLRTAQTCELDPDRLSFTNSIHLIIDALPLFELAAQENYDGLWQWLMSWMSYFQLPPRRDRSNPRVIKRQQVKFPRKRKKHLDLPQPSKPFREAIVVLT